LVFKAHWTDNIGLCWDADSISSFRCPGELRRGPARPRGGDPEHPVPADHRRLAEQRPRRRHQPHPGGPLESDGAGDRRTVPGPRRSQRLPHLRRHRRVPHRPVNDQSPLREPLLPTSHCRPIRHAPPGDQRRKIQRTTQRDREARPHPHRALPQDHKVGAKRAEAAPISSRFFSDNAPAAWTSPPSTTSWWTATTPPTRKSTSRYCRRAAGCCARCPPGT
jgi:hypothetical protein